jgi:lambda family phage portal protein
MAGIFQRARAGLAKFIAPKTGERSFAGAAGGRLYADWFAAATSADAEIRGSIRKLIDRSRSLERDNDYQRGFLLSAQRNINGSMKYDLRVDAGEYVPQGRGAEPKWQSDKMANRLIEQAWQEWGKKGNCTICKRHNWRGVRRLTVRSTIRDGNFIARRIVGKAAKNKFGFALQLWEIDHLDLLKFQVAGRGQNEIRFGIEFDHDQAPVAYWLKARHPGDFMGDGYGGLLSRRFEASEIYHVSLPDRAEQSIGYPWIVSAITRLRQLGAFEEAAVIAARLGASKAAFLTKNDQGGGVGAWLGPTDANGRAMTDIQPGTMEELPTNWGIQSADWQYPNVETGDFRKAMLRGVAAGLGVSYTNIGNDLESVNFSSARVGLFEEREGWKELQIFFSDEMWERVFADWLEAAIMSGAINLPLSKFAKFNRPVFKARRWAAIDPIKEIEAAKTAIALRVGSRRQYVEEQGGDIEETMHDNLADEELAADIGLSLAPPDPEPASGGQNGGQAGGNDDNDDDPAAKPKATG